MDLDDSRASSVRPHENAGGNIADHQRDAEKPRCDPADQAGEDDQDEIGCDTQRVQLSSAFITRGLDQRPSS